MRHHINASGYPRSHFAAVTHSLSVLATTHRQRIIVQQLMSSASLSHALTFAQKVILRAGTISRAGMKFHSHQDK